MLVGQLAAIAVLAFLWIDGDSDISVVAAFSSCVSQFDHRQRQFASFALSTTSVRPYATRPSKRTPTFAARPTVKMLVQPGGRDALVELSTKDSTYSKTVRKTPRSFRKIASIASLPAAALTGFALTPSRRIIAHGVGGAIAGVAGVITKSRLDIETEAAAKPALAQLLLDNDLNDPNLCNLVQQLKTDYGVNDDDFMEMATDVYKRYLAAMVKHPHAKTSEIAELTTLTSVLGLDNIAVGEAHAIAAKEVYRNTCTWTPEEELDDPEHPDRMSLDKLLFLSERAFRNNRETDEAFKFEFSRVCKAFNVTGFTGLQRVANVAEPFYQRALDTTRIKLNSGAVNPDMLARARNTLGISDSVASDMHIATYAAEVKSLLGLETEGADLAACQFPKGALKRLENLRSVLQISEEDAAYEQSVEVTPIFQATVLNVMKDTTTSMSTNETDGVPDMEHMWSIVESRKNDLCLSDDAMIPLLDSVIVQTLGMHIEEAATFAAVDNESGVYSKIVQAVKVKNSVSNFLSTSPFTDVANRMETYYDMDSHNAAFAFINADVRKKIYQMFLAQSIRQDFDHEDEAGISPEMNAKLMEVRTILGVDEVSSADVTAIVCGPIVEKALRTAADEITGGDATPELFQNLKARNERLLADLKLPTDLIFKYSGEIYKNFLRFVKQNTPSGIPSSEFSEKMSALRELLNLGEKDISSMHLAMFGTTYKKSVLEAMGSTGIIVPEYRAALERLRIRLGFDIGDATKLFQAAVSEKMVPIVKRIEAEMERTLLTKKQLAQKRGQDMGDDVFKGGRGPLGQLGIGTQGNVMGEIINLVDFYTENGIVETRHGNETSTSGKFYPVTALGENAVQPEMAEAMYRQFIVGGFTTQGKQAERYEKAAPTFGGILGLSKQTMQDISGSVGSTVYENFIENALRTKPVLDQQDMMFLANIQSKLNLPSSKAEQLMLDAQKKVLRDQAQKLFQSETVLAADVVSFRERCSGMGVDLASDLGISRNQIASLFVVEVKEGIEKGQITPDNSERLAEIQEGLGMSIEDGEQTLEGLVKSRVDESLDVIDKELMRGREASCIEHINALLKFAAFVDGDLNLQLKKQRANKILSIFSASDFKDVNGDVVDSQIQLLKQTLGISEN